MSLAFLRPLRAGLAAVALSVPPLAGSALTLEVGSVDSVSSVLPAVSPVGAGTIPGIFAPGLTPGTPVEEIRMNFDCFCFEPLVKVTTSGRGRFHYLGREEFANYTEFNFGDARKFRNRASPTRPATAVGASFDFIVGEAGPLPFGFLTDVFGAGTFPDEIEFLSNLGRPGSVGDSYAFLFAATKPYALDPFAPDNPGGFTDAIVIVWSDFAGEPADMYIGLAWRAAPVPLPPVAAALGLALAVSALALRRRRTA